MTPTNPQQPTWPAPSTPNHVYGWRQDPYDPRDNVYHVGAAKPVPLPDYIDLAAHGAYMPPVYDQGQLGSCSANAIAAAVDYERAKQGEPWITPSRLAIYYDERKREQSTGVDSGAVLRDGIKVVANGGCGPESLWPYDISKFTEAPPAAYYLEARQHRALSYSRVSQADYYIGHCLAILGRPMVFGGLVYEALESAEVARTGILPMPGANETPVGGHAMVIVGRDVANDRYKVRNSWGKGWGLDGYFWMPRKYALSPALCSDFWVILKEA